ncbi:MAG TPA: LysR substrate-binding domain-containing protein [Burkholderiales bacterium]|jgi:DNA-binding transcriptional LysR family regulator|nr:LysR substrate-binding domain-containing protein [Burkholderiales bacterium]
MDRAVTRNLDIDLLRSFAAVADSGSFTAAAELVARTQSAVSVQIRRLEEILGHKVFERTSRSLALTRAGDTLLAYARRILELNDESVRRIAEPPVAGVIRLGITEYFVPTELPRILSRFAAAYPGVQLEVRMGISRDLRQDMAAGALDAALVRLAARERAKAIWSEALNWMAREGDPPERGSVVPLALLPAPCWLRDHAIDSMKRLKRPWKLVFTGSSMASVQAAVGAGLGVSIMPRSSFLPGMQILPRGREYPDPGRLDIGVLRGPRAPKDIVQALERVIRQTLDVLAVSRAAA